MAEAFCKDKLRAQAWDRFQRVINKKRIRVPQRGAEAQWARDVIYLEKLETVVAWCAGRSIDVHIAKKANGMYEPDKRLITLSGRASPEKMLHYLLHECGHHLIGMEEHHERFGNGYPQGGQPRIENSYAHRMACLEEEFEAWHRGWKLAKRLKLQVDRESFDKTRLDCLKSYVEWTSRKKDR